VSENVFLPVTPQMVVSIPEITYVRQVVSVPEIVRVPSIIFIPELRSDVSLVPNACDSWISAIRHWRDTIALRDSCYRVWTGTRNQRSTRINRPPVREGW
jgi:hypothetical protein